MFEQLEILRMAGALAGNAEARQAAIARNIANADTPGYKAVDVPDFASTYDAGTSGEMRRTLPGHLGAPQVPQVWAMEPRRAPGTESPDGNTVSVEDEMVAAAQVKQQHDMALAIYRNATTLMRTALGRAR